jgi:alkylation response protein AidB-like acyl-CoA dehydrogenase
VDFGFTEEQQAVAELARKILEDRATNERLKDCESSTAPFDVDLWEVLAESNLLGTAIPEELGGSGLGLLALGRLMQEVGRSVAPVPAFPALVLGALPVAGFGSAEQKQSWLPGIARGGHIMTAALAELETSDPLAPATRAQLRAGGFRLSGKKTLVPCGEQAARILVPAALDDGSVGLFYVEPRGEGVALTAQETPDGLPHAQLQLSGAPVVDRLDARSDGREILRWLVERATAVRCMMQLGVTERALEMTAAYGRERVQFERPIGSFQAFHQRVADAYIHVEAIRLSAWEAAWRLSEGLPATQHVAVAKFWAAEGGQFASFACQHLHGGIGIDKDYPLHRYFTWAIQIEHELGSARHQLERLGGSIAAHGLPAS